MSFHFCTTLNLSIVFSECSCVPPGTVPAQGAQRWAAQGPAHMEVNDSLIEETKHIPYNVNHHGKEPTLSPSSS